MTVSSQVNRKDYAGNSSTTNFATVFRFLEDTHLRVILTVDSTGVETVQALTTDYTVTGKGDDSGGTVTMVIAPATGATLTIKRDVPSTQLTDYVENDDFPAESHERALDKLTMIVQQQQEELGRSLKLPESNAGEVTINPEEGKFLIGNDTGGFDNINVVISSLVDNIVDNVAILKLVAPAIGDTARTKGYHIEGDNGQADYLAVSVISVDNLVNHISANASAVWILQTNRINVLQAGAKGDGVTDDSASIQAAIDFEGERGSTFLPNPASFYLHTTGFLIPNGATFEGEGFFYNTTSNQPVLVYTGTGIAVAGKEGFDDTDNTRNVSIRNLRIEVNGVGSRAIQLEAAKSCVTENIFIFLNGTNNVGFQLKGERNGGVHSFCGYNYTNNVRIRGNGRGNGHRAFLLSGALADGQCNGNKFGFIAADSIDIGFDCQVATSNVVDLFLCEIVDTGVRMQADSSWNKITLYMEVYSDNGIQCNSGTQYNQFDALIMTQGGLGGNDFLLEGNRNEVHHQGKIISDGNIIYQRAGTEDKDIIQYQDLAGLVVCGITKDGARFSFQPANVNVDSSGVDMNLENQELIRLTFTGSPTSGTITAQGGTTTGNNGQKLTLFLQQDGVGSHVVTQGRFSANFLFDNNSYTLTTAANAVDILRFERIGGSWYEVSRTQNLS